LSWIRSLSLIARITAPVSFRGSIRIENSPLGRPAQRGRSSSPQSEAFHHTCRPRRLGRRFSRPFPSSIHLPGLLARDDRLESQLIQLAPHTTREGSSTASAIRFPDGFGLGRRTRSASADGIGPLVFRSSAGLPPASDKGNEDEPLRFGSLWQTFAPRLILARMIARFLVPCVFARTALLGLVLLVGASLAAACGSSSTSTPGCSKTQICVQGTSQACLESCAGADAGGCSNGDICTTLIGCCGIGCFPVEVFACCPASGC
jgi:hypothetical protein